MYDEPELVCARFSGWRNANNIAIVYIQPGKPQQKGFIERFNGSFRREFLDAYLFGSIHQVRDMAWLWRIDYNKVRPYKSLGLLSPAYRKKLENSSLEYLMNYEMDTYTLDGCYPKY